MSAVIFICEGKMGKRYVIKEVDCPEEKCPISKCVSQSECMYGDTKEQLINKIKTIYIKCLFDKNKRSVDDIVKDIVEYLGVK